MSGHVNYNDFHEVFEQLVQELVSNNGSAEQVPEGLKRFEKVLRYNVPLRVKMGGYPVVTAIEKICGGNQTPEQIHLSYILGWCWRMNLTFLSMIDANLGEKENQFGTQTWYHVNNRKPIVMVDTVLVEQGMTRLLRKYFGSSPHYSDLLSYFSDATFKYLLAKTLEPQLTKLSDPANMQQFTMARYLTWVRNIISQCYLAGPPQLAMILAGVSKKDEIWARVEQFCESLTEFWAVKQDFKDSFVQNGLPPEDANIKTGNCTWLVAKALEICDQAQRRILEDNYGKNDVICVSKVKNLLVTLRIPEMCKEHLDKLHENLKQDCEKMIKEGFAVGFILKQMFNSYGGKDY